MPWHTDRVQRSGVTGLAGVVVGWAGAAAANTVVAATMTAIEYLQSVLRIGLITPTSSLFTVRSHCSVAAATTHRMWGPVQRGFDWR